VQGRDTARDTARDTSRERARDTIRDTSRDTARDTSRAAAPDAPISRAMIGLFLRAALALFLLNVYIHIDDYSATFWECFVHARCRDSEFVNEFVRATAQLVVRSAVSAAAMCFGIVKVSSESIFQALL
jgi:hypothetical protein